MNRNLLLLAPLAAATLLFAGARCESPTATPTTPPSTPTPTATSTPEPEIGHALGAADVVFRYSVENYLGMYPPYELTYDRVILYGDGTLLVKQLDFGGGPQPGDRYTAIRLTEAGVQRLLATIVDDARLLEQPGQSMAPGQVIADAGDPHFVLTIDGGSADVRANCLGCEEKPSDLRERLHHLDQLLAALDSSWFDADEVTHEGAYEPPAIRVAAFTAPGSGPAVAWPEGIEQPEPDAGHEAGLLLCGDQAETVRALLDGTQSGLVRLATGTATVRYRPVLPDEPGCDAMA